MDALKYHTASVEVQFSGNTRSYHYLVHSGEWVEIKNALDAQREVRVVIPGAIKNDRLSTSVATVVSTQATAHSEAVLPIVSVVSADGLERARAAVVYADQMTTAVKAGATA